MIQYDFDDKTAFATGAVRGQGNSHVLRYAEHSANVFATDICETAGASTHDLSGNEDLKETITLEKDRVGEVMSLEIDVADEAEIEAAVDVAIAEYGGIDILANNASVAPVGGLIEIDQETWDLALDVNLKGMWLTAKHVGHVALERRCALRHGYFTADRCGDDSALIGGRSPFSSQRWSTSNPDADRSSGPVHVVADGRSRRSYRFDHPLGRD